MNFYFSLQYSAIQQVILRHDRLWSMAGISLMLSELNEIILPGMTKKNNGTVLVAGGGKFTAGFDNKNNAEKLRNEAIREISITFPMLEFQASAIVEGERFSEVKKSIVNDLNEQKRRFRGYGVTYNPQLKRCEECGEYPATECEVYPATPKLYQNKTAYQAVCAVCFKAKLKSKVRAAKHEHRMTTIEKIYRIYFETTKTAPKQIKVPHDFEDLFPQDRKQEKGNRMAVWFSDINSMGDKVTIWLSQEENNIFGTFRKVKETFIKIVADALIQTFPKPQGEYLPFRIVIAGGDDLCIVMAEKYIIAFTRNLSDSLVSKRKGLADDDPLNIKWFEKRRLELELTRKIQPYCFGGSFIITSILRFIRRSQKFMKSVKN